MATIFILTNRAIPDYIKIGTSSDLSQMLAKLNKSNAIPTPFEVYATYESEGDFHISELFHLLRKFKPAMDNTGFDNGFAKLSAQEGYAMLESVALLSGTKDKLTKFAADNESIKEMLASLGSELPAVSSVPLKRRSAFSFAELGIPVGSEIRYVSNPEIVAKVVNDKRVEYNGIVWSLSRLAEEFEGKKIQRGPDFFTYDGVTLDEMRRNIERGVEYHDILGIDE